MSFKGSDQTACINLPEFDRTAKISTSQGITIRTKLESLNFLKMTNQSSLRTPDYSLTTITIKIPKFNCIIPANVTP